MRKVGTIALALGVPGAAMIVGAAQAADVSATMPLKAPINCRAPDAPYKDYKCMDAYLGDDFFTRLVNYYRLEMGHDGPPADPKAPPARRAGWGDASPQSVPPYPFNEWPYGGATSIGVTRPSSVDSPLMVAMGNSAFGNFLNDHSVQIYGWVNGGGNLSTNTVKPAGNAPAAYDFTPNTVQLDQAVVYIERLPDTVQTDHLDWGFRFSAIYGENYRYTTAYGIASYQLLGHNLYNGYDFPMVYGELYIPWIGQGTVARLGRYISVPDIEAQLAPNNYMYTHSLTYTFDNYTNTGLQFTTALNKNWFVQYGVSVGSDTAPWNAGARVTNPFPNQVYPDNTMLKDPGAVPSVTLGVRWQSDSGKDNVYVVGDAINGGQWGYNNLQWTGITWYHKFNDQWHFSWETYTLGEKNVLNQNNVTAQTIIANGGFPFNAAQIPQFTGPSFAQCDSSVVTCDTRSIGSVAYINYRYSALDNFSLRLEYFNDMQGQRTGVKTQYAETGIGWQHWLSPQIELRPEITYYNSLNAPAFNGNVFNGIAPDRHYSLVGSADIIWHF
jgi:hypothetical protein